MAEIKRSSNLLETTGLVAYAIVCLGLFVCIRFPYDTFRGYLEQSISSKMGQPVTLGHIHARLPVGITIDGMSLNNVNHVKSLIMKPHFLSLATGRLGMDVKAVFPSGSLTCSYDTPMVASKRPVKASVKMENFDSSLLNTLFASSFKPQGAISGLIDLAGPGGSLKTMGGTANLVWKNGLIPLSEPQMPISGLKFNLMEMNSRIEKGVLTLDKMEFKGETAGTMNGNVFMMDPPGRSRLSITGMVTLSQAALPPNLSAGQVVPPQSAMRFSLRGTLDRPRLRILGLPR